MRPKPHSYEYTLPKKVRRGALRSALSLRAREGRLMILDAFSLPEIKTKEARRVLEGLGLSRALIVEERSNATVSRSVRNLPTFQVLPPEGLNVRDILRYETLVLTTEGAKQVEERLR